MSNLTKKQTVALADVVVDHKFNGLYLWGVVLIDDIEYCFILYYDEVFYIMHELSLVALVEKVFENDDEEQVAIIEHEVTNSYTGEIILVKRQVRIADHVEIYAPYDLEKIIEFAYNDEQFNSAFIKREQIEKEEKERIEKIKETKKAATEAA